MEENSKPSKEGETGNFLKRKVSVLVWHCLIIAIFNILYPPMVMNYVISNDTLKSHQSHMMSNDHEVFNNDTPKEELKANNPAENLKTKKDPVIGEKIPKSPSATPAPQKSIKTSKKTKTNKQRVIEDISSSSRGLGEVFHLERYKDISSFPEENSLQPPDNVSNLGYRQSRHLQVTAPNEMCNGTWFHLNLQLDFFPGDTSWELVEIEHNKVIANESYGSLDAQWSHKNIFECIENVPHRFTLFDSWGDGIQCGDSNGCYDVYVDGKLVIDGPPFSGEKVSYDFDSSALCPVTSSGTFILHMQYDHMMNSTSFQLIETSRSTEIPLEPFDNDMMNHTASYFACLLPGYHSLIVTNNGEKINNCGNETKCYESFINNISLFPGNFVEEEEFRLDFLIFPDGSWNKPICPSQPLLAPFHPSNVDAYNETIAKSLDVLKSLSSPDLFQNHNLPQYKAACFVLYDDIRNTQSMSHLIERYILSVFYFAVGLESEVMKTCGETSNIMCNSAGYIERINYGKYTTIT